VAKAAHDPKSTEAAPTKRTFKKVPVKVSWHLSSSPSSCLEQQEFSHNLHHLPCLSPR